MGYFLTPYAMQCLDHPIGHACMGCDEIRASGPAGEDALRCALIRLMAFAKGQIIHADDKPVEPRTEREQALQRQTNSKRNARMSGRKSAA